MKDDRFWIFGTIIFVAIILLGVVVMWVTFSDHQKNDTVGDKLANDVQYDCPKNDWSGYTKDMVMVPGGGVGFGLVIIFLIGALVLGVMLG